MPEELFRAAKKSAIFGSRENRSFRSHNVQGRELARNLVFIVKSQLNEHAVRGYDEDIASCDRRLTKPGGAEHDRTQTHTRQKNSGLFFRGVPLSCKRRLVEADLFLQLKNVFFLRTCERDTRKKKKQTNFVKKIRTTGKIQRTI